MIACRYNLLRKLVLLKRNNEAKTKNARFGQVKMHEISLQLYDAEYFLDKSLSSSKCKGSFCAWTFSLQSNQHPTHLLCWSIFPVNSVLLNLQDKTILQKQINSPFLRCHHSFSLYIWTWVRFTLPGQLHSRLLPHHKFHLSWNCSKSRKLKQADFGESWEL